MNLIHLFLILLLAENAKAALSNNDSKASSKKGKRPVSARSVMTRSSSRGTVPQPETTVQVTPVETIPVDESESDAEESSYESSSDEAVAIAHELVQRAAKAPRLTEATDITSSSTSLPAYDPLTDIRPENLIVQSPNMLTTITSTVTPYAPLLYNAAMSLIVALPVTTIYAANNRSQREWVEDSEHDINKYIFKEIIANAYGNSGKDETLKTAIKFIARNDYIGFLAFEANFAAAHGHGYNMYKRGPAAAEYWLHYIIRFGATNFLLSPYYCTRADENSNLEEAFYHLLSTKPFNVYLDFLLFRRHTEKDSVTKIISTLMQERYDLLHFLNLTLFEADYQILTPHNLSLLHRIFYAKNNKDKLDNLLYFMRQNSESLLVKAHYSHARYLEAFFIYRDYFLTVDMDTKIIFAKLAIINEDTDKLVKIVNTNPGILYFNPTDTLSMFAIRSGCNLSVQTLASLEIASSQTLGGRR